MFITWFTYYVEIKVYINEKIVDVYYGYTNALYQYLSRSQMVELSDL